VAGNESITLSDSTYVQARYATLEAIINSVTSSSAKLIMLELRKVLSDKEVQESLTEGIMPYIYAAGFLSFAGREITKDSLTKTIESVGIKPNIKHIETLGKVGLKSHLIYLYAFYFILANGHMATEKDMEKVVESVGADTDHKNAQDILKFLESQ
jgi:ribosomal protein L12E/L44/L45/RPP1/RPP2